MEADLPDLIPIDRAYFAMVMTELHQKFVEKNMGEFDDDSCSWTGSDSISRTTVSYSSSVPDICYPTRKTCKPKQNIPTMGPLCAATIQLALISLRPVDHPLDFPTVTTRSYLLSPVQSPRFSLRGSPSSVASDNSETSNNRKVLRSIKKSRELTRSVEEYLKSVNFITQSELGQEYESTSETYEFQPTSKEDDTHSNQQSDEPGEADDSKATSEEGYVPQPPEITIIRIDSCGSGDQPRARPTVLEQILEAKRNLKPVHLHEVQMDIMEQNDEEKKKKKKKKKRGFFERLKFWKKQPRTNQDDVKENSEDFRTEDLKKSKRCSLLCCFRSPQIDE